jgi:hypothetical protein
MQHFKNFITTDKTIETEARKRRDNRTTKKTTKPRKPKLTNNPTPL